MNKKQVAAHVFATAGPQGAAIRIVGLITGDAKLINDIATKVDELLAMGVKGAEVYINTYGGNCDTADEIVNVLRRLPGKVTGQAGAVCASAGTYILSKLDRAKGYENTMYMIHRPVIGVTGNADDVTSAATRAAETESRYLATYVAKTGKKPEDITSRWQSDWWMTAKQALAEGFIDEIVPQRARMTPAAAAELRDTFKEIPAPVAALIDEEFSKSNPKSSDMKHLSLLVAACASADFNVADEADEAQVLAAAQRMANEVVALRTKVAAMEAAAKTAAEAAAKAYVQDALKSGKITAKQVGQYERLALQDLDAVRSVLDEVPAHEPVHSRVAAGGAGGNKHEGWDYGRYMREDAKALAALKESDPETFNTLKNDYLKTLKDA